MPRPDPMTASRDRRGRGPVAAGPLALKSLRGAMEKRGFAQARLLSQWPQIVGSEIASVARPVKVSYNRVAMTGTLVLLVSGANAPVVDMRREEIRRKVNACYGYNAIGRIKITQTAATGFSDGQARFEAAPPPPADPETVAAARDLTGDVADDGLREALSRLAVNILSRNPQR